MSSQTTYTCDRCGSETECRDEITNLLIGYRHDTKYDLCKKCIRLFELFMKNNER